MRTNHIETCWVEFSAASRSERCFSSASFSWSRDISFAILVCSSRQDSVRRSMCASIITIIIPFRSKNPSSQLNYDEEFSKIKNCKSRVKKIKNCFVFSRWSRHQLSILLLMAKIYFSVLKEDRFPNATWITQWVRCIYNPTVPTITFEKERIYLFGCTRIFRKLELRVLRLQLSSKILDLKPTSRKFFTNFLESFKTFTDLRRR